MTYEERLQMYAQKHADEWNTVDDPDYHGWTADEMNREAKVTISAVAEAIRKCALIPIALISKEEIEQYLIENGYVPKP